MHEQSACPTQPPPCYRPPPTPPPQAWSTASPTCSWCPWPCPLALQSLQVRGALPVGKRPDVRATAVWGPSLNGAGSAGARRNGRQAGDPSLSCAAFPPVARLPAVPACTAASSCRLPLPSPRSPVHPAQPHPSHPWQPSGRLGAGGICLCLLAGLPRPRPAGRMGGGPGPHAGRLARAPRRTRNRKRLRRRWFLCLCQRQGRRLGRQRRWRRGCAAATLLGCRPPLLFWLKHLSAGGHGGRRRGGGGRRGPAAGALAPPPCRAGRGGGAALRSLNPACPKLPLHWQGPKHPACPPASSSRGSEGTLQHARRRCATAKVLRRRGCVPVPMDE